MEKGNEMQFPDTRWSYMDLPPLTNEQRFELALRAQEEGEAYYQRALKEA
ncbi:MAG: hypothetical protein HXS54_13305, partial [Theionarchaea archaeon]|nr:hypothetical protein [Theionarchaea archaeon]